MIKSDEEPIIQFWGHYYEFKYFEEMGNEEMTLSIKNNLYQYKEKIPKTIWNSLLIEK